MILMVKHNEQVMNTVCFLFIKKHLIYCFFEGLVVFKEIL